MVDGAGVLLFVSAYELVSEGDDVDAAWFIGPKKDLEALVLPHNLGLNHQGVVEVVAARTMAVSANDPATVNTTKKRTISILGRL